VAPRTVQNDPVARVASRRGLVVTAHAEVLPVADEAAVPVPFSHEAVGARPPCVVMVTRHLYVVTGDAIGLFMADETGIPRISQTHVCGSAMILKPVPCMRLRPWKGFSARRYRGCRKRIHGGQCGLTGCFDRS